MGFGFLNALMLIGLAGVSLPILAHLISKRRYDVVQWGAMRFLELGQRTKRRIRLQDLLLLLLRMGVLACLALALARPWGTGRLLGALSPQVLRDYVFVIDSSSSMEWQEPDGTPHQRGIQWIYDALEELAPGETVALIDARNTARRLISPPTTDLKQVREKLAEIPEPAGTSRLPEAIEEALKILTTTSNVSRKVVVLGDDQALAWRPDDEFGWARVDDMRSQTQVTPEIDVVNLAPHQQTPRENCSVGRLELSRAVTVPEFPITIRALIRQSGGVSSVERTATLKIDGQQIPGKSTEVELLPDGEALVEFEHVFPAEGHFLVTISIEPDQLPADDQSAAVISITSGIPVLLVDGDPQVDAIRSETFFLKSAFSSSDGDAPWVHARVIRPHELTEGELAGQQVVFLCNVEKLTQRQWQFLRDYVEQGGGLVIAPGDRISAESWNTVDGKTDSPLLAARFVRQVKADHSQDASLPKVDSLSLEVPWLQRFRQENGVDFTQTRFLSWWELEPVNSVNESEDESGGADEDSQSGKTGPSLVLATLTSGAPFMVRRELGYGSVVQLSIPLDADWSTLPARNDFVPFLYELVFALTANGQRRNVDVGAPLLLPLESNQLASDFIVSGPGIEKQPVQQVQRGRQAYALFATTLIPGIYRFESKTNAGRKPQLFVVDDEHNESVLTSLSEEEWKTLSANGRLQRVETMADVSTLSVADAPRAELWWLLLIVVLVLLVCEVALTRKMVQGGHAVLEEAEAT